jgi:hypothetical protein
MIALLWLFSLVLASPFKSKCRLEPENAALRHQVMVLRRQARGRVHFTNFDRLFLVQLYRWFPSILQVLAIVQPGTVIRWHRAAADRCGIVRFDPENEHREPDLRRTAHPWRVAQAWL